MKKQKKTSKNIFIWLSLGCLVYKIFSCCGLCNKVHFTMILFISLFGLIVYNRVIVYTQKFPWRCCPRDYRWPIKSSHRFVRKMQVTYIYSHAVLVTVTSECRVKRVICKPGLGHLGQCRPRSDTTECGIWSVCTVCLNYRKLRVKWSSLKCPFRTVFPAYTQRQSTHQYCQCFDICKPFRWQ